MMQYDPAEPTGVVQVVEVKTTGWIARRPLKRRRTLMWKPFGRAHPHTITYWDLRDYDDMFYRGNPCPSGQGIVDGWRYDLSAPLAGVVMTKRTAVECGGHQGRGAGDA